MSKWIGFFRWVNVLLILATFLSYLSPLVSPAKFWPLSFFGLLYPWLLLGNVLCILGWLLLRRYYFLFSLACVLAGWNHLDSYVGWHFAASAPEEAMKVMSFNAYGFRHDDSEKLRLKPKELPGSFPLQGMDIICFQEFPATHNQFAADFITNNSPLKHAIYRTGGGLSVFSRFPIRKHHTHYFPNRTNGFQYADLEIDGRMVRLFNMHLQSNSVSTIADRMAQDGNLQERETWSNVRGMMARYKQAAVKRAQQAEEIAREIRKSPHPVLLCGDFNEIPQSYVYHTLSQGLQDAFKAKGRGLGITYNGKIPALRIDYILADSSFEISSHRIRKSNFSDHFPVIATLQLK